MKPLAAPGPWLFDPATGQIRQHSRPVGVAVGYAAAGRRNAEANGQLMATAPELLAALQAVLLDLEVRGLRINSHIRASARHAVIKALRAPPVHAGEPDGDDE